MEIPLDVNMVEVPLCVRKSYLAMRASCDMSPELLQRWIDALPPGCHFFRAEMRGALKQKFTT